MKIKITLLILISFLLSCKKSAEKKIETRNSENQKTEIKNNKNKIFEFERFEISKGQLGDIKVGMNINEAEKKIKQLTKTEAEAYDFGYDGGGKSYIYSLENEPILALIPKMDSEEILAILALSKNLKTIDGLNPKSKIFEIQNTYPNIEINLNLMMSWEYLNNEKNNWTFVFMTDDTNRIGEYKNIELPAKPKRTQVKTDWIAIE